MNLKLTTPSNRRGLFICADPNYQSPSLESGSLEDFSRAVAFGLGLQGDPGLCPIGDFPDL